jgi:hypothetical protein
MFFMILLPREDPIFGFEGLSKTVDTLSGRNNYVPQTTPMDSESKPFTTTRCINSGWIRRILIYVHSYITKIDTLEHRREKSLQALGGFEHHA